MYIVTHTVVATFVLFFSFLFFVLFCFLIKDYNKSPKRKGKPDVQDFPRAMAKLRKSAEKVKKTLSASKEYVEERGRRGGRSGERREERGGEERGTCATCSTYSVVVCGVWCMSYVVYCARCVLRARC